MLALALDLIHIALQIIKLEIAILNFLARYFKVDPTIIHYDLQEYHILLATIVFLNLLHLLLFILLEERIPPLNQRASIEFSSHLHHQLVILLRHSSNF